MQRNYLLTAVTAAALGAGTVSIASLADAGSAPETKPITVQVRTLNTNPTVAQIWSDADTALCPLAENQDPDDAIGTDECSIEPGTVLSLTRGDTHTDISITFQFAGTYVKGSPQ